MTVTPGATDPESTALLDTSRAPSSSTTRRTPLPLFQLAILCLARICDPIVFTFVFPFMNNMIEDLQITSEPSDIAFYAGLVDGLFALAQFTTAFYWGSLSDRIGRRPVIFIGLSAIALWVLLLGLSRSLLAIIITRALAGITLSNVAVIQSVLGEITDSTNAARAIPLTAITWSVGCIIGPMIGSLHHPSDLMPNTFGNSQFHRSFPYFFPCFIVVAIILFSLIMSYLFLNESLRKKADQDVFAEKRLTSYGTVSTEPTPNSVAKPSGIQYSAFDIASIPAVQSVLSCAFLLNILATSYDVLFIVVSSTPIPLGGLSRSATQISSVLGIGALFSMFVLPVAFAPLQERLGSRKMYRYLMVIWPASYIALPLVNGLARLLTSSSQTQALPPNDDLLTNTGSLFMWIMTAILVALPRAATMCLSLHILLFKSAAPSPDVLGSTFGLGQTVTCIARAVAPAFSNSLYASFGQSGVLGGQGVWLIMSSVGILGVIVTGGLRE